jgi:NTP pyrophosphatase (non-canonical NTP hydrolase)
LDFQSLQEKLRRFAAERDWQPFHTPKNLAMALLVEAAELAEIFQWLTPEQSQAAKADAILRERVAHEVADVLLYLAQLADQMEIDIDESVDRKLLKNARKHPPLRPAIATTASLPSQPPRTHVLIDWENTQPEEADVRTLVPGASDVWLFHGPNQKNVTSHHAGFGDRITPVRIARTGKNALDFHLTLYIGFIAARDPAARFVVISNDKGYGPMLDHAKELGFAAERVAFDSGRVEGAKRAPVKRAGPEKMPTKKAVVKKPVAKKIAGKKVPAKKSAVTAPPAAKAEARTQPVARATTQAAKKSFEQVRAILKKSPVASRPGKYARLLAHIASMFGADADEPEARAILDRLIAHGNVSVDDTRTVTYSF